MRVIHEGRGGFIEEDDLRFQIEHIEAGHFCIHLPRGVRLPPEIIEKLKAFAAARNPAWYVDN